MNTRILQRAEAVATWLIVNQASTWEAAKFFGVSQHTIWFDVSRRLPKHNPELARKVGRLMDHNKAHTHARKKRGLYLA